jgi:hypothetical protein
MQAYRRRSSPIVAIFRFPLANGKHSVVVKG